MTRHGVMVATLVLAFLLAGVLPSADAQPKDGILHRVEVQYWLAGGAGPSTSWTSNVFRLKYSGAMLASPFGLRASYLGGGAMGEAFWAIDLTYRPAFGLLATAAGGSDRSPLGQGALFRVTAGYASFRWNFSGGVATSAGFGFGAEATFIIASPPSGGKVALVADYVTYPSNNTTAPLGSGTGPASAWSVGIRYKLPAKKASESIPGTASVSTLQGQEIMGADWDMTAGYQSVTIDNPLASTYRWSGFFIGVGKTF